MSFAGNSVFKDIHGIGRLFSSSTNHSWVSVTELFSQHSNCETGEGGKEPESLSGDLSKL